MRLLAAVLLLLMLAAPLAAQRPTGVQVALPPLAQVAIEGPIVRTSNILGDRRTRDLLRSGFPARLHFRVELWETGLFDDLRGHTEWDVVVRHDPLMRTYEVARIVGSEVVSLGSFPDVQSAQDAVDRPFQVPLTPNGRRARLYYSVVLQVEMLSLSDLDEVERWLKGELRPAVRGRRNPGTALTRGVRTLMLRLMGSERREYRERTPSFHPG